MGHYPIKIYDQLTHANKLEIWRLHEKAKKKKDGSNEQDIKVVVSKPAMATDMKDVSVVLTAPTTSVPPTNPHLS